MILYTCGQKKSLASLGHPCGRAAKALDECHKQVAEIYARHQKG